MNASNAARAFALLLLAGAPAFGQQPDQPSMLRALPMPPAFTRQPERLPEPPPPKPPQEQRRPPQPEAPQQHGSAFQGFDLTAVMHEEGSPRQTCELGFDIANVGDRSFDTITINLSVVPKKGPPSTSSIYLKDTLDPQHGVAATLELARPCDSIEEVRLIGFSRCSIDGVPLGTCRPPMLMRSDSRIRFGL